MNCVGEIKYLGKWYIIFHIIVCKAFLAKLKKYYIEGQLF